MKKGDIVPLPAGMVLDREAVRAALARRGRLQHIVKVKSRAWGGRLAARIQMDLDAREHATRDPFEQARLYLGRRGFPVFSTAVYRDDFSERTADRLKDQCSWMVGADEYPTRAAVIRRARIEGWRGGKP